MTENTPAPLLLKIEFTTEGTQIFFNKEWENIVLISAESQLQALSALSLLNILVDSARFEKEMKHFAKSFDIEELEENLAIWENKASIH